MRNENLNSPMNFFEQELHRLFSRNAVFENPKFTGRACFGDLGKENRVKLQFVTLGYADHYEGLKATVLNRTDGPVDSNLFRFGDIWGKKQVSNPNFREGIIPHIWMDNNAPDWYVYHPTDADFRRLAAEVNTYLEVFLDRVPAVEKESVVDKLRTARETPKPHKGKPANKNREAEL